MPTFFELHEHTRARKNNGFDFYLHGEQRSDHGEITQSIDEEAVAFADDGDDHSGKSGSDETRSVDHGGVERDGVAEVSASFDHLHEEGLPRGHVEGVDQPLKDAQHYDFGNGDASSE